MKKIILILSVLFISVCGFAQKDTDTYTVNKLDGTSETYKINEFPQLEFNETTFGNIMSGFEDFGIWDSWNIDDVRSVSFDIYHEADVSDVQLADNAANDDAKRLYKYLKLNYGVNIISSIIANVSWNNDEATKIYQATGKYPAMNCYDFIHMPYSGQNWINYDDITPVTNWVDAGGLVSLMWHFNVPM